MAQFNGIYLLRLNLDCKPTPTLACYMKVHNTRSFNLKCSRSVWVKSAQMRVVLLQQGSCYGVI